MSAAEKQGIATVGRRAPDFLATTSTGEQVRLSELLGKKVVLYFYPKDATPGCTRQACGFRDLHEEFRRAGAVVFGVSPDGEKSHRKFRERQRLPFELLVDGDHAIATRYGVWQEKSAFGMRFFGVVRSHFVIDETGMLVEARVPVSADAGPGLALEAVRARPGRGGG